MKLVLLPAGDHGSPDLCSDTQKPSLAERSNKRVLRLTMPTRPCLFTRTMAGNTTPLTEDERNYYMGDALWTGAKELIAPSTCAQPACIRCSHRLPG